MADGIESPLLHMRTIHYGEVDVLLCQPLGAIRMRIIDVGMGMD